MNRFSAKYRDNSGMILFPLSLEDTGALLEAVECADQLLDHLETMADLCTDPACPSAACRTYQDEWIRKCR